MPSKFLDSDQEQATKDLSSATRRDQEKKEPRRKRSYEGLFCTESEDEEPAVSQPSVSRTKKAKLEVAKKDVYESSYCEVNGNGRKKASTMEDMTKALMGVQESPKASHSCLEQATEYEYCGFLIAPRHSDEAISQAFVAHDAFRLTLSPETRAKTPYSIIMPPERPPCRIPERSVRPPPDPCPADLKGIAPVKGIFEKIRAKRLMKKNGDRS
ncbi:MAG: hypothetical protein M1840_000533 [Geoglossum simile]|nr:MAG: hypothetical protein M1840_000533 [Geoglossum simile]